MSRALLPVLLAMANRHLNLQNPHLLSTPMTNLRNPKYVRLLKQNPRRYILQGVIFLGAVVLIFFLSYFTLPAIFTVRYDEIKMTVATSTPQKKVASFVATHLPTPPAVKGIYMTSWVAGSKELRNNLVKIADTTEINSIVIDIKDYTGKIAFAVDDPYLQEFNSVEKRIPDIRDFIATLHQKGIYVIGRISAFQDPQLVKLKPEWAVRRSSDGGVWKDYKGISWLDAGAKDVWRYLAAIGKESYRIGFDELNFDYIRFPSDGNMKDISYPFSDKKPKPEVLREFFAYLEKELHPTGAVLSADLFGMTTTNTDDLNIGQLLENALPYFDYVSPMVYPSHYPPRFMGFAKPAEKPYEVVKFSMDAAVKRALATTTLAALLGQQPISTTTKPFLYRKQVFSSAKIRPWLQDFNLGATYTAEMVRLQIQATYDAGLDSWMLWNASNRYTAAALHSAESQTATALQP